MVAWRSALAKAKWSALAKARRVGAVVVTAFGAAAVCAVIDTGENAAVGVAVGTGEVEDSVVSAAVSTAVGVDVIVRRLARASAQALQLDVVGDALAAKPSFGALPQSLPPPCSAVPRSCSDPSSRA